MLGTILFHLFILALLLVLGFSTPLPLPEEEGVEVNLGYDLRGSGTIQPMETRAVSSEASAPSEPEPESRDVATQVTEEAPAVEDKSRQEPTDLTSENKKEEKTPEKEVPKVNPNALYKGKSEEAKELASQGETEGEGDQGIPQGTTDATRYIGPGGTGDGLTYSLTGRSPKYLPKPSRDFTENGTVVVQITVDKYGKVIKAVAIDKGSNTTNTALRRLAEQAAGKAIFNANPDAPDEQKGTITYHFVVKS